MAAIIFASKLNNDDSLTIPRRAIEELGLHPGDEVQVSVEAPPTVTVPDIVPVMFCAASQGDRARQHNKIRADFMKPPDK